MGKYDDLTADLPPAVNASGGMNTSSGGGRFDDLTNDLPSTQYPSGSFPANPLRMGMNVAGTISNLAPWNKVNAMYKGAIGNEAEFLGKHTPNWIPPQAIAAATLPAAMFPEILGTATGLEGIYNSKNPMAKGLVNTPQELGPEYAAQNEAIGVTRRIPLEGGQNPTYPDPYQYPSQLTKPKYIPVEQPGNQFLKEGEKIVEPISNPGGSTFTRPKPQIPAEQLPSTVPIRYPSKPADFMSYANNRLKFGTQLNPQELMDWQVKLQTDMSNGTIPKIDPTTGKTTTIFQQASDLKDRIGQTFNQIAGPRIATTDLPEGTMPTREGLNAANAISNKQQKFQNLLKKGAEYTAGGGASGYGAYQLLKNLLSKSTQ